MNDVCLEELEFENTQLKCENVAQSISDYNKTT